MNPRVVSVIPKDDYSLLLTFSNKEKRIFNTAPYLDKGVFSELKDISYFKMARQVNGTVQWPHEQDFCPDSLYEESKPLSNKQTIP